MAEPIEIKGLDDIYKKLNQLPDKLIKNTLHKALEGMTDNFVTDLQGRAPVGKGEHLPYRTRTTFRGKGGSQKQKTLVLERLRDSIKKTGRKTRKFGVYRSIVANFYAKFLERGTKKMAARPFIRPVMDSKGEPEVQKFCDVVAEQISKVKY